MTFWEVYQFAGAVYLTMGIIAGIAVSVMMLCGKIDESGKERNQNQL